eukprot:TRINITY_DN110868_c0_g1_i1.p1 TRINITY_DN110868_c0_g1~~TRINITY_DN110868_c0_g1_i1.p1  ORF type:complete len:634 (-),score=192.68 TRINITY_DN110868_c0_g1_i1:217-2040(-)
MTRKTARNVGLGQAIVASQKRAAAAPKDKSNKTGVADSQAHKSVLEQSSLDDFIASAELGNRDFEAARGGWREALLSVQEGPRLIEPLKGNMDAAVDRSIAVPIPRRPEWSDDMDADELASLEGEAFLDWRRSLAELEEDQGFIMTPYEKNLDFWRQLWRTVERSDLLVQIIDSRDPLFYVSKDLERYVKEFPGKQHLLLLNKADFVSAELRQRWTAYFASHGVEAVWFSALRELHRQNAASNRENEKSSSSTAAPHVTPAARESDDSEEPAAEATEKAEEAHSKEEGGQAAVLPPHGCLSGDDHDVLDCSKLMDSLRARLAQAADRQAATKTPGGYPAAPASGQAPAGGRFGTVGFIGYPNVGKSSVINALFGAKKVSMSRIPGKTKHLQTLELPGAGITLVDCPGLVMPSLVATKSHLVINGTVPLEELRDYTTPVRLVIEKMGLDKVREKYAGKVASKKDTTTEEAAHQLLADMATARGKFLRLQVPDETWSARRVLKDFCSGELLHCEDPPAAAQASSSSTSPAVPAAAAAGAAAPADAAPAVEPAKVTAPAAPADEDSDDFSDLDDFLNGGEDTDTKKKGKPKKGGKADAGAGRTKGRVALG